MAKHGTIQSRVEKQIPIEGEIWKPVIGYEGVYEVSDLGRVKRVSTGLILSGAINACGYRIVILSRDAMTKNVRIHRLVAQAFLGDCPKGQEVNHKDRIRTNNQLSNLEYVTHKQNMEHRSRKQRRLKSWEASDIKQLLRDGNLTQREIAKQFRVNEATISRIKYGKIHNVHE